MTIEAPPCQHHWMIDSPDGTYRSIEVEGRCKICGTTRMFRVAAQQKGYGQRMVKSNE